MPRTPATVTSTRLKWPCETPKPANSIVASEGIGMHALSSSISTKIPASPRSLTTEVAASTSGPVMEAVSAIIRGRGAAGPRVGAASAGSASRRPRTAATTAAATARRYPHGMLSASGGGSKTPVRTSTRRDREQGRDPGSEDQAAGGHEQRLAPDEAAELSWPRPERGGDGERAPALLEAERERQSGGGDGEHEREAELDPGQPRELDRRQVRADDLSLIDDVGHARVRSARAARPAEPRWPGWCRRSGSGSCPPPPIRFVPPRTPGWRRRTSPWVRWGTPWRRPRSGTARSPAAGCARPEGGG